MEVWMLTYFAGKLDKFISFIAVAMMVIAGVGACAPAATGGNTTPNQSKAAVKIGISLSLTGDRQADGVPLRQGYEMWRDDVNKKGGLFGRQVQLDIVNDNSDANQVVTN